MRYEFHGDGIYTVPGVFGGKTLADEHMSEMSSTIIAKNLGPSAVSIGYSFDMTLDLVIKAGPTTTGIEFVIRSIKRVVATSTDICSH
jgi:hypothetical protein